jgi:SAM-dependent methyltransferase
LPEFDADAVFDEDYLYFYAGRLSDTRSNAETDLIWTLLDLRQGTEVLDLACGDGRIANRLAERGCRVTGLDATPLFLDRARRDAQARWVGVDYVHGDMRALPWTGRFEVVLNWFTAFGYFDDPDNRKVLDEAYRALVPGGRLVLEMNNYSGVLFRYQSSSVLERDGNMVVDQHQLDPLTSRNIVRRTTVRDGSVRHTTYFVRMFTFPELRDWLLRAGFARVSGHDETAGPLVADSRRMIVVAERD